MKKFILLLPLIILVFITIFLFIFLLQNKDPSKPPSALLNENLPKFIMVDLFNSKKSMYEQDFREKPKLKEAMKMKSKKWVDDRKN